MVHNANTIIMCIAMQPTVSAIYKDARVDYLVLYGTKTNRIMLATKFGHCIPVPFEKINLSDI